jgi:antitoxin Phd
MDHTWQEQEAKSRFSEQVNKALSEGPQIITRHGNEVAVLISYDEFK